MKDKTDDIDNINWKLSGKLNDLRPQKEISVQIKLTKYKTKSRITIDY